MPEDVSIDATVSGGMVGVAGAKVVRIENLYVGVAAPSAPERPTPSATIIPPSPYKGLAYLDHKMRAAFSAAKRQSKLLPQRLRRGASRRLSERRVAASRSVVLAGLVPHARNSRRLALDLF